jgi:predicted DNA binding CopG/RHH family protein
MTFDVDRSPATPVETTVKKTPASSANERQQIGARIPVQTYRQLKARAALDGLKVQDLVEQAIDKLLATKI